MRNKLLLFVVIVLGSIYFGMGSSNQNTSHFILESEEEQVVSNPITEVSSSKVKLKNLALNTYDTLDMEDYLVGVVAGEMPASFNIEALKAQAVAARSYAYDKVFNSTKDYDLTTDATTQVYITIDDMKQKWGGDFEHYYGIVKSAVEETKNQVLTYDGMVIPAYYFAMGNGTTEDSVFAFGQAKEYLVSVNSYEDVSEDKYNSVVYFEKSDFCNRLGIDCTNGINISNIKESNTNRIISITINGETFTGKYFKYALGLKSNDAYIEINDKVKIITCGWGHGVGMSQYGANNMANLGYNYEEILTHFYTGVKIENINSII